MNDAFAMFQWGKHVGVNHVVLLADGNGAFTRRMEMLVDKSNLGLGQRSWSYSMLVNDRGIEKAFVQSGFGDNCPIDPFKVSESTPCSATSGVSRLAKSVGPSSISWANRYFHDDALPIDGNTKSPCQLSRNIPSRQSGQPGTLDRRFCAKSLPC